MIGASTVAFASVTGLEAALSSNLVDSVGTLETGTGGGLGQM